LDVLAVDFSPELKQCVFHEELLLGVLISLYKNTPFQASKQASKDKKNHELWEFP
jgi:hypothetical protein